MINLCKLIGHKYKFEMRLLPDPEADIIEELIYAKRCKRCNRYVVEKHYIWNFENSDWDEK